MNSNRSESRGVEIPAWVNWFYGFFGVVMVPWVIYLQLTLPSQRAFMHWRMMWIGFDLAILAQIMLLLYLLRHKSPWAVMVQSSLGALFITDAWFDIQTSSGNSEVLIAVLLAVTAEIPLAAVSIWCAVRITRRLVLAINQQR
jgi:hypothetical protein